MSLRKFARVSCAGCLVVLAFFMLASMEGCGQSDNTAQIGGAASDPSIDAANAGAQAEYDAEKAKAKVKK